MRKGGSKDEYGREFKKSLGNSKKNFQMSSTADDACLWATTKRVVRKKSYKQTEEHFVLALTTIWMISTLKNIDPIVQIMYSGNLSQNVKTIP